MPPPIPTPIYRITHIDNLRAAMARGAVHAALRAPEDGLHYRVIHDIEVQESRGTRIVERGPGGELLDYVPFYFGPLSPMLYRIKTGWGVARVEQSRIIYLVSSVQRVVSAGHGFVFFDGHALANLSSCHDDLRELDTVDWSVVGQRWWNNTPEDPDRQRRKQAEFLVHGHMPWELITEVGVLSLRVKQEVAELLGNFPDRSAPVVSVRPEWYY